MTEGKKYVSDYKGSSYNVFISPNDKMDAYSVSVYNGNDYVGAIKGFVSDVKKGLKEASNIIISYHKNRQNNKTSSADGITAPIPKNDIKLAWLDSDKTDSILHSQTFNSIPEALKAVTKDKRSWFIFKKINEDNNESSFELLPYGNYKDYSRGVNVTSNVLVKTFFVILSGFGAYFLATKIYQKVKS